MGLGLTENRLPTYCHGVGVVWLGQAQVCELVDELLEGADTSFFQVPLTTFMMQS